MLRPGTRWTIARSVGSRWRRLGRSSAPATSVSPPADHGGNGGGVRDRDAIPGNLSQACKPAINLCRPQASRRACSLSSAPGSAGPCFPELSSLTAVSTTARPAATTAAVAAFLATFLSFGRLFGMARLAEALAFVGARPFDFADLGVARLAADLVFALFARDLVLARTRWLFHHCLQLILYSQHKLLTFAGTRQARSSLGTSLGHRDFACSSSLEPCPCVPYLAVDWRRPGGCASGAALSLKCRPCRRCYARTAAVFRRRFFAGVALLLRATFFLRPSLLFR